MLNKIIIACLLFLGIGLSGARAQEDHTRIIDSLRVALDKAQEDSVRIAIKLKLSDLARSSDIRMSVELAESAIDIAKRTGNLRLLASSYSNAAYSYFTLGNYSKAAKYFYLVLDMMKRRSEDLEVAYLLINIGALKITTKQFSEAEKLFLESQQTLDELQVSKSNSKYFDAYLTIFNNLGITASEMGDTLKAVDYYKQGIKLAQQEEKHGLYYAMLLNNLGKVLTAQGMLKEAFRLLKESLELRVQLNDITGLVQSHRNLAAYYAKSSDRKKSREHLYESLRLARIIGNNDLLSTVLEPLYESYLLDGRSDSALKYLNELRNVEQQISKDEVLKEITKLELTAQFEERERQSRAEHKRRELIYVFSLITLLLLAISAILLYSLSRNRLKRIRLEQHNTELKQKHLELEKKQLEQELEFKNKELTTNVLYQIKKNEIINDIAKKLVRHIHRFKAENQDIVYEIVRDLEHSQKDGVWDEFELRFQHVQNEFFERLQELFPDLTNGERRLCAFLRLNMTTKEIASITGLSPRSIEVARTRLRRKLKLTNADTGLIEFLSSL